MENQELGMKWYKFIIYFALFAGALLNATSALTTIAGAQYGTAADTVYQTFSGLKTIDVIYGIVLVGVALLCIVTRILLKRFYYVGVYCLMAIYAINFTFSLFYAIIVTCITGISVFSFSIISNLAISIIMVVANWKYFDNRKHLFR